MKINSNVIQIKNIGFQSCPRQIMENIKMFVLAKMNQMKAPSTANLVGGMLRGIDAPDVASS